jgi:hypothetical protein
MATKSEIDILKARIDKLERTIKSVCVQLDTEHKLVKMLTLQINRVKHTAYSAAAGQPKHT